MSNPIARITLKSGMVRRLNRTLARHVDTTRWVNGRRIEINELDRLQVLGKEAGGGNRFPES